MKHDVYTRALQRAAGILGGTEELSTYLAVPESRLESWMDGAMVPPPDVFLRVVDLLHERQFRQLSGAPARADPQS